MKNELIFPIAAYVFFLWLSTMHMFRVRVRAVRAGRVSIQYYRTHLGEAPPEHAVRVGRHYDNQFQLPVLFFITCLAQMQLGRANGLTLTMAWAFVASRGLHSWIMLRRNILRKRILAFALGWLIVLAMWIQLVCFALT